MWPREYTAVCLSEPPLAVPLLAVVVRFKTQQRQQATKTVFFFFVRVCVVLFSSLFVFGAKHSVHSEKYSDHVSDFH